MNQPEKIKQEEAGEQWLDIEYALAGPEAAKETDPTDSFPIGSICFSRGERHTNAFAFKIRKIDGETLFVSPDWEFYPDQVDAGDGYTKKVLAINIKDVEK